MYEMVKYFQVFFSMFQTFRQGEGEGCVKGQKMTQFCLVHLTFQDPFIYDTHV